MNTLNLAASLPPRNGSVLKEAIDFTNGRQWDVRLMVDDLRRAARISMGRANETAYCLPEVLLRPTAIFQGVREEGEAEWICYCGVPSTAYAENGSSRLPKEGRVFLAFLNHDRVVYAWRWDEADSTNPVLPKDHGKRFTRRVL